MSIDLHIHFPQHHRPVHESQGLGDMLARHAQAEAVRALVAAILMQLMQALAQAGQSAGQSAGPSAGPEGAGGADKGGGAGKSQSLLGEFDQLLQLLNQLAGGSQSGHQCKDSAQHFADALSGGGQTLDQIDEPGHGSSGGSGSGGLDANKGPGQVDDGYSSDDSGLGLDSDNDSRVDSDFSSDSDSGSDSDLDVSPDKPTGSHGAGGTKPADKPEVGTGDTPSAGGGTPSSKVDGPPPINGEKVVNQTIVVKAGETFDGKGMHFKAGPALGDGGQGESQKPVFELEPGAKLKNVQLSGADGVHAQGDATLDNVWWRDVGEDAFTMKGEGNVTVNGGGAFNASDKIFQLNHGGSFTLNNFTADTFGKAIRTNGGKDFPIDITVNDSTFRNGEEAVVRSDATQAKIKLAGNTIEDTKFDVIAPQAAKVEGAHQRGWKDYTG